MQNWYRQAQDAGTPGSIGANPSGGALPAVNPNSAINPDKPGKGEASPAPNVNYAEIDRLIKNNILKPLYNYLNTFMNSPYPNYNGENNPFMEAMIQLYDTKTIIGFKRQLDSYLNVSRLVVSGTPNPALQKWIATVLTMFPEGEAKTQLRVELNKISAATGMQGRGV